MVKSSRVNRSVNSRKKSIRKPNYYKKQSRILSRKSISKRLSKIRFSKLRLKSKKPKLTSKKRA